VTVATAPALPADVEPRAARALQRNHPEAWLLYEGHVLHGRPLGAVARGLGIDDDTGASELDDAGLILAAYAQGLWDGQDFFDFADTALRFDITEDQLRRQLGGATKEELATEALQEHEPTKWAAYHGCIVEGQTQRNVGARLGLSHTTVACHCTDARLIIAAFQAGVWDGQSRFSFRRRAKQLHMTERELRRKLADLALPERECDFCHKPYMPSWRPDASNFCSENCRHTQAKERAAKTCPFCETRICGTSNTCAKHVRLRKQLKPCQRCGDPGEASPATGARYCSSCLPLVKRDYARSDRARHPADTPCAETGCPQLVTKQCKTGFCRAHAPHRKQARTPGRVISMDEARRARKSRQTWVQAPLPLDLDEPKRRRASR